MRLYGQARGRGAEYWGEEYLDEDKWVRTMGVPTRAVIWYGQQSSRFRELLDSFAAGMNAYAADAMHSLAPDAHAVLPVSSEDVLAHAMRVMHLGFVARRAREKAAVQGQLSGSNGFAVSPAKSESGNALLLINPHLGWSGYQTFFEAHLSGPGVFCYGATLVGMPVLLLGFTDHLGWTHTVNTYAGCDMYELEMTARGYRWGQGEMPIEKETQEILVSVGGRKRTEKLTIERSIHGPILAKWEGGANVVRVAGLDQARMIEQWWHMSKAASLTEFQSVMSRLQIPMLNVVYADTDGHIFYLFNGRVPRRSYGDYDYWKAGIAPGVSAENLWDDVLGYDELPKIVDPASGWIQSCNDPPWTATFPAELEPGKFPSHIAPRFVNLRAQRASALLESTDRISFDDLVSFKHDTRVLLADRVLDELLNAVESHGDGPAREAAAVLASWNRRVDATSRGAVLFARWATEMGFAGWDEGVRTNIFAEHTSVNYRVRWSEEDPLATPKGLARPHDRCRRSPV